MCQKRKGPNWSSTIIRICSLLAYGLLVVPWTYSDRIKFLVIVYGTRVLVPILSICSIFPWPLSGIASVYAFRRLTFLCKTVRPMYADCIGVCADPRSIIPVLMILSRWRYVGLVLNSWFHIFGWFTLEKGITVGHVLVLEKILTHGRQ